MGIISNITSFLDNIVQSFGAPGIGIAMFFESVGIPFVGMPAQLSAGHFIRIGRVSLFSALVFMTLGNVLGSTVSYFLGYGLGDYIRRVRNEKDLFKSEKMALSWLSKHGKITFFLFQLYGTTRTFGSFPAGLLRYNYKDFILATFLGGLVFSALALTASYLIGNFYEEAIMPFLGISFGSAVIIASVIFVGTHLSIRAGKNYRKNKNGV